MLLLFVFILTQTSAFKNWIKDQLVETVNDQINGIISVGKIDGTIFTSIILQDVALMANNGDTVASFSSLIVKTSPLKLLFKDIYVRKVELRNAYLNLYEESDGELNLLKIFPSSDEPDDTTATEFPFTISVADLEIINLNFNYQKFKNRGSVKTYKTLNTDDIRIDNLNLSLSAFANIDKSDFKVNIKEFNFRPNLDYFELINLSGDFLLTQNAAMVDNLNIETQNTNLNLSAAISEIDFINNFSMEDLGNAPIKCELNINNFNFNTLLSFVETTEFLNGNISGNLQASGSLNTLNINKLNLSFGDSKLICNAKLENLLADDQLTINATLDNTVISLRDVSNLLKDFGIPNYNLGLIRFSKLRYSGKPTEFTSEISLESSRGNLSAKSSFNFKSDISKYDIELITENFDLLPFISFNTNLNSQIKISGEGFEPSTMNFNLSFMIENSRFESFRISSLDLNSKMFDKILSFNLDINSDTSSASFNGKIDFIRDDDPYFNLTAYTEEINIAEFLNDSTLNSNLNLNLEMEGRGFDIDSMNLFLVLDLENSFINNFNIDSTRLILDIRRNDNGNKVLNMVSNVADFTISGNYKLSSLFNTLGTQFNLVINQIKNKISEPLELENNLEDISSAQLQNIRTQNFEAKLLLDFKDFAPFSYDDKNSIEIGGEIKGNIISEEKYILLNLFSDIKYLKFITEDDLFFITKSYLDLSLKQLTTAEDNFNTKFSADILSERIYFGSNLYDFSTKFSLDSNSFLISGKGFYENSIGFDFNSNNLLIDDKINFEFDKMNLNVNGVSISNREPINLAYSKGNFSINQLTMDFAEGVFDAKGIFGKKDNGLIKFDLKDAQSNQVIEKLLDLSPSGEISSQVNLFGSITGNFDNPTVTLNSNIENIKINEQLVGSIKSDLSYSKQNINVDFKLTEVSQGKTIDRLVLEGNIPLKNKKSDEDTTQSNREIELKVIADDLNISALGKIIPEAEVKQGFLESEIYITGFLNKPYIAGYININDLAMKPLFNNLEYYISSNIYWEDEIISIEKATITNESKTKFGGTIQSSGFIKLKDFSLDSISITANGSLKVLDQISKEVNQFIYGDLSLETKSEITFTLSKNEINLNLPINITKADLVLPLARTAYANTSDIIYRFATITEKSDVEYELNRLIEEFQNKRKSSTTLNGSRLFNYNINLGISNEAKVVVILSKELNQDLTALLSGNILLNSKDGITRTGGQFNLLEGSKLSFIKTFEARGNVRFENLSNPLIDITATYRDYYYPVTETGQSTEQEVAIKIKLKGPFSELNQNFVKDPENIGVYVGAENIQKEQRDETKTPTDALFFIIAGKFTDGATLQERSTVASTATSFAGSVIGNVLNQYLGDYVRGVQLRQFGDQTKFSLIGKVGNFRYEIGGTTEVFQDLSRANVKIELPIQQRLILRLERKESFTDQSTVNAALYNEFGIKYKFEF